mmetsp:Transcript_86438/g.189787  ORF Transcript_86438/g.189787 Transcript_86438/m.189787 type:complete len:218 (-) Transcript_86438:913-1566(-)
MRSLSRASTVPASTATGPSAPTQARTSSPRGRLPSQANSTSLLWLAWPMVFASTMSWCAALLPMPATTTDWALRRPLQPSFRSTPARASRPTLMPLSPAAPWPATTPRRRWSTLAPETRWLSLPEPRTETAPPPSRTAETGSNFVPWALPNAVQCPWLSATLCLPLVWPTSPASWRVAWRSATPWPRSTGRTARSSSLATVTLRSGPRRPRSAGCPT